MLIFMNWSSKMLDVEALGRGSYDVSTVPYKTVQHDSNSDYTVNNDGLLNAMGNISGAAKKSFLPFPEPEVNITNHSFDAAAFALKKSNTVISSALMFGFGVFGNILALLVLMCSGREQRKTIFYRLVAGLTITDLLGITMTSPVVIAVYVNDFKWIGGQAMCNYFGYVMIFAGYATMTIVCTMSIERVICIKHPYVYHTRLSKKHATIFLMCSWSFAAFIAALPLFGFGDIVLQYPYTWCFFDYYTPDPVHTAFNYLFAVMASCIISVTVFCNLTVIYTLMKSWRKKINVGNSRKYNGYSKRFAECQMLVLLLGITVVFSSCYTPLMVRIIINQTGLLPVNRKADLLMIRLASWNQILDPWVYILLRRELVWKVIQAVKFVFGVKPKEQDCEMSLHKPALMNENEGESCCWFCLHCLCDPPIPQRQRSESLFSTSEYEMRRSTIITKSPLMYSRNNSMRNTNRLVSMSSDRELNALLSQLQKSKMNGK